MQRILTPVYLLYLSFMLLTPLTACQIGQIDFTKQTFTKPEPVWQYKMNQVSIGDFFELPRSRIMDTDSNQYTINSAISTIENDETHVYSLQKISSNGILEWDVIFGQAPDPAYSFDFSIGLDANNDIYVVGSIIDDASTTNDLFIAKYNPQGSIIWVRNLTISGVLGFKRGVIIGENNQLYIYNSRTYNVPDGNETATNEVIIHAYDIDGNQLWHNSFPIAHFKKDPLLSLAYTEISARYHDSHLYFIVNELSEDDTSQRFSNDIWLKYDQNGVLVNQFRDVQPSLLPSEPTQFPGDFPFENETIRSISGMDQSGNLYVVSKNLDDHDSGGKVVKRSSSTGTILWQREFVGRFFSTTTPFGESVVLVISDTDSKIIKLDPNGQVINERAISIGKPGSLGVPAIVTMPTSITVDPFNRIYVESLKCAFLSKLACAWVLRTLDIGSLTIGVINCVVLSRPACQRYLQPDDYVTEIIVLESDLTEVDSWHTTSLPSIFPLGSNGISVRSTIEFDALGDLYFTNTQLEFETNKTEEVVEYRKYNMANH